MDKLKNSVKEVIHPIVLKLMGKDDVKFAVSETLKGLLPVKPVLDFKEWDTSPYPELGKAGSGSKTSERSDIIFITGRFRSGSTFLWNIFRSMEGYKAYYEPFNEGRWFDPQNRSTKIDSTHKNVSNYWEEYRGLEVLCNYYKRSWTNYNLLMEKCFWNPEMKTFIETIVEHTKNIPVLQFNRIDFRLPWIRHNFINSKIIHLYRHPRDQWCSSLFDINCFSKDGSMEDFIPHDQFYLREWGRNLKYHFPFLNEKEITHPYEMFYYIWKLSYLFGINYAHFSIGFEKLITDFDEEIKKLFEFLGIKEYDLCNLRKILVKPDFGKWKNYADEEWFLRIEERCEFVLNDFFEKVLKS